MGDQTAYRIVRVTPETKEAFEEVDRITWFDEVDPTDTDLSGALDLDRSFAATRTGEPPFAGNYSSFDQRLTIPGPGDSLVQVPCAGLTWVSVHPDDRRTGVLSAMMRHHLDDVHDQGVALGSLHASEVGIYGRFGYAQASLDVQVRTHRDATLTAPGVDTDGIRTELVSADSDSVAERCLTVHLEVAPTQLGQVTLTPAHVRRRLRDAPASRRGSEPGRVLFAVRDGVDIGYATVRRTPNWANATAQGALRCWDLTAADPRARLALVRRLVSFDLIGPVELPAESLEDEVIWWLGGPRAAGLSVYDSLWVRLVDVPSALGRRGYATDVDVVLDVDDDRCAWNTGRWRLVSRDGVVTCEATDSPADLGVPVQVLGSAYLGGRSVASMARQGLVTEHTAGAVAALSAAMATSRPPVGAQMF